MNDNRKHNHSSIRRVVAAVLIVAAAVVFVGVVLVFQCLSFDENGAHVVDRYGVLAMEAAENQNTGEETPAQPEEPQEQPAEEQPAAQPATRAAMLSADSVAEEGTVQQLLQLAQEGTLDTVIVNIKDSEGYLNIHVDTNVMDDADVITESSAEELEQAIQTLREADVHVIGRIFCMHDQKAVAQNADLAMQYDGGGTWLDYDNTRWLDATNRDTVEYLCDIAKSAVEAGCDEILLDEFTFPARGHIDRIDFDDTPQEQAEVLLDALQEIQEKAEVPVSLTADTISALTDLSDSATEDGFPAGDVEQLLTTADRIFVPAGSAEDAAQAVAQLQQTAPEAVVIPILDSTSAWMAYEGDAVLRAVDNTAEALAVMGGERADSTDDSDEPQDSAYEENPDDSYEEDTSYDDSDEDYEDDYDGDNEEDYDGEG